jgi:DNA end-binding protein Ku
MRGAGAGKGTGATLGKLTAMPRAIWTGSISFGLLNVPVKLYSAVSSRSIRFRELREGDGSRVKHKRVAENDGEEVPYEKIVKGYEIAPDQYIVLEPDELAALDPKKSKAIEIEDFVDLDEIDPIYFNQPYYLGPNTGAERAYALLAQAMSEQRKVAIARFVLRNKESLAAIRATGDVLTLATMRFADEVVPPDELDGLLGDDTDVEPKKKEVEMAKSLIDSLASDFDPTAYKDEHREQVLELIERKANGENIVSSEAEAPKPTKAPDLMAALEESLAAVRGEELGGGDSKSSSKSGSSKSSSSSSKSKSSKSKSSSSSSKSKAKGKSRAKAAK